MINKQQHTLNTTILKKKTIACSLVVLLLSFAVGFFGCDNYIPPTNTLDTKVLFVDEKTYVFEASEALFEGTDIQTSDIKLIDYMDRLVTLEALTYQASTSQFGMFIDSINGVAGLPSQYWMIYSTDTANSDTAWGEYNFDGKTLGSASLGASELPIIYGELYAFVLESF